jgi:hypothetical protein
MRIGTFRARPPGPAGSKKRRPDRLHASSARSNRPLPAKVGMMATGSVGLANHDVIVQQRVEADGAT